MIDTHQPIENPKLLLDLDALKAMRPEQAYSMLMQMNDVLAAQVQRQSNMLDKIVKHFGNIEDPKRTIRGSEFINVTAIGSDVIVSMDEDKFREANPPPQIPGDPQPGGGDIDATWEAVIGQGCIELNQCNYPLLTLFTWRLTNDGLAIVRVRFERVDCPYEPCTPEDGSSGNPDPVPVDRWRLCGAGEDSTYDIFVPPGELTEVLDFFLEPVIQLGEDGACFEYVETTTGTITHTDVSFVEGCDNEACNPCYCNVECIRFTDTNGDWIEVTIGGDADASFCDYDSFNITQGGPNGGLAGAAPAWVEDHWEVTITGPSSGWTGLYLGPTSGCPLGLLTKLSGDFSSSGAITASTCDCGVAMRIVGYTDGMFGDIKRNVPGDPDECERCGSFAGNGDDQTGMAPWDGTMPFKTGSNFHAVSASSAYGTYKMLMGGGQYTAIKDNTGVTDGGGADWHFTIPFQCAANFFLRYKRPKADGKAGIYLFDTASVSADAKDCGEPWPASITLECYTP